MILREIEKLSAQPSPGTSWIDSDLFDEETIIERGKQHVRNRDVGFIDGNKGLIRDNEYLKFFDWRRWVIGNGDHPDIPEELARGDLDRDYFADVVDPSRPDHAG
jgi:hypothetical protein